jgi:hypothetical protein
MRFSDCGNFLHGVKIGTENEGEPVFLHLAPYLPQNPALTDKSEIHQDSGAVTLSGSDDAVYISENKSLAIESRRVQLSGVPQFTKSQGQLQISALSQDYDSGSILLQTMRADGKMIEETITRLPKSSTLEKSYSALVPTNSDENLKLVLNMAVQETYSTVTFHDFQLPAVLERQKGSIPTTVYAPLQRLEPSANPEKRTIEETEGHDDESDLVPKKRK